MMGVAVRDYTPGDFDECVAVFDSNVPGFFTPAERPVFEAFLKHLPGPYLVVEEAGTRVMGCGGYALADGSDVADLCWGMVLRPLHRRGLGRLLTELRIQRAVTDPRVTAVRLDTSQHTTGFYEQLGFHVIGVHHDGYGPGLHRCEMRLDVQGLKGA